MFPRRSGAPPRFLIFRSPETRVKLGEFVVFNLLFGFAPLFAVIFGFTGLGGEGLSKLLDPRGELLTLSRPLDAAQIEAGAIRVRARVTRGEICHVVMDHYTNKNWRVDHRGTHEINAEVVVEESEGAGAPAPGEVISVAWERTRWEPPLWLHHDWGHEMIWRERLRRDYRTSDRVRDGCLRAGDRFFLEGDRGAVNHGALAFAGDPRGSAILTAGSSLGPRLVDLGASLAARAAALGIAALTLLWYLRRAAEARPFVNTIIARLRQPRVALFAPTAIILALLLPLFALGALWLLPILIRPDGLVDVDRRGFAVPYLVVILGVFAAGVMIDRARALSAAIRLVREGRAPPLDRAREGEALALDLKVDPRAQGSRAPLSGKTRAHWFVAVTRVFSAGRNWSSEPALPVEGPMVVPVVAEGRAAMLDLTHASVDLRAVRRTASPRALRRRYRDIVAAPIAESTYVLEERYLHRGEVVHVIGRVMRFEERGSGEQVPVIGGAPNEPLIVHAGTRRSLLRGVLFERAALCVFAPIALAMSLAAASLAVYVAHLARLAP